MSRLPFSPPTLLWLIAEIIRQGEPDQPHLKNPQDAIAIFTHACMLSIGFRLVGLSEDDRIETPSDGDNPKPLPPTWNAASGHHGFRYTHPQSSMQFLVKINRLGVKTVIMGLGLGDDKPANFDIVTKDFTSESFFPFTHGQKNLEDGFISESRMADLASLIKINIVQKLVPGITKPGYEEERESARSGEPSQRQQQPYRPFQQPDNEHNDPLRIPRPHGGSPRGGIAPMPAGGEPMPGFDDEYDIFRQPRGGYGYSQGGRNPLSIGEDDLNPPGLGPNPPLRGPFFGEGSGMGGMHPGPDHPMFGGRSEGRYGRFGDPRAPPPGARYDPVGPGDEPPTSGLRGPRGPGGPGGPGSGPYNPFSSFGSGDFM